MDLKQQFLQGELHILCANGQLVPSYDPLEPVIKDISKDELPSQVLKVF